MPQFEKLLSSKYAAIAIILIASVGVYLNTLWNGFVFDDEFQVLENPWIKDVKFIPEIFTSDVWAFKGGEASNYYRPLLHVIFMIEYHIFELKPWGFHLTNIIFHAGISAMVFLIASMLFNKLQTQQQSDLSPNTYNLIPAFIAALLFATHPIHTEVVAWVSGIPELSFTFFYLLSFYFYIKADGEYGKHFMLSILFFFLSTLCKETALTLPILLLAYDYSFRNISLSLREHLNSFPLPLWERDRVRGIIKRYLPYLIVSGIYFILRTFAIGGFAPLKRHAGLNNYEYFINIFPLFIQYLEKLLLPVNLNAFYVFHPIAPILEPKGIISIVLALIFISFVYMLRRNRIIFFSFLWIVIPILPVLYIPALGEATFAERYLYLPSVGFVILVSLAIEKAYQSSVLGKATLPAIISIFIIITGLYSTGTIKRHYIWKDGYNLWTDTVKKSPDGAVPHYNLGLAYSNRGLADEAIEHYQIALKIEPYYLDVHNNLGLEYYKKGWVDKAIEHYQIALRLKPDYPTAYSNLGAAYHDKGLIDKAIEHYQIAIKLDPNYPEAHYNLGLACYEKGWIEQAIEHFQISLRLKPDYPDAHNDIGNAYIKKGWTDKAMEHHHIALKLKPDFPEAHYNLGNIYGRMGLKHEAMQEFEIALRIRPDFKAARQALESLTGKGFAPLSPTYEEGGANFIQ